MPRVLCWEGLLEHTELEVGGLFWLDFKREDLLGPSASALTLIIG